MIIIIFFSLSGSNQVAARIVQAYPHKCIFGKCLGSNGYCSTSLPQFAGNKVIPKHIGRTVQKIHIPENTAPAELVLALQVTAIAPLQNQYSQGIFTIAQMICDIKLTGGMCNLAVTNVLTVQPNVEAGIYTFKIQESQRRAQVFLILELGYISTARIVVGYVRRIRRKRIARINVMMQIVTMHLPVAGNRDGIKVTDIIVSSEERIL